jgi:uncharacterized OsmC-like protein
MMGTLAKVLAGKKIRTFRNLFQAVVTGDIEDVDGVLKITRINVAYNLKVPENQRGDALAALENYIHLCPAAQSVVDAIAINHEMTLEDMPV